MLRALHLGFLVPVVDHLVARGVQACAQLQNLLRKGTRVVLVGRNGVRKSGTVESHKSGTEKPLRRDLPDAGDTQNEQHDLRGSRCARIAARQHLFVILFRLGFFFAVNLLHVPAVDLHLAGKKIAKSHLKTIGVVPAAVDLDKDLRDLEMFRQKVKGLLNRLLF